jgi:hypothetical protein
MWFLLVVVGVEAEPDKQPVTQEQLFRAMFQHSQQSQSELVGLLHLVLVE